MMNITKLKTKKNVDNRSGKTGVMRIKKGICYAMLTGILVSCAGAGAWYMKIYKPKHEFDDEEEYEEYEEAPVYEKDDADMQEAKPEERAVLEDEEEEDEDGE